MVKTQDNTTGISLPKYVDTYTWYGVPQDATTWGEQYLPNNLAPLGSRNTISYDDGPKTARLVIDGVTLEYPVFKFCQHTKSYVAFRPGSGGAMQGSAYCCGQNIVYNRIIPGSPHLTWFNFFDLPNAVFNLGYGVKPEIIQAYVERNAPSIIKAKCLEDGKMLGFPDAFNVLNFILELKDLKRLPELLHKWKFNSHDVSDKYLGTSFGVLPFVGDIMSIIDRVLSNDAVRKWDNMAARNKVLNAHTNIPPPPEVYDNPYFVSYEKGVAVLKAHDIDYHVAQADFGLVPLLGNNHMKINIRQEIKIKGHVYFIPKKIDNIASIKASLWGLNKPLTAIWNALPFSFVLDWIVNIGSLITEFERGDPLLMYRIVSSGYSMKVTTYVELPILFNSIGTGTTSCKSVTYLRRPISPASVLTAGKYYPFRFTVPTGEQTLLGSALLHQLLK